MLDEVPRDSLGSPLGEIGADYIGCSERLESQRVATKICAQIRRWFLVRFGEGRALEISFGWDVKL